MDIRQSPARSARDEMNSNVAANVAGSRIDTVPYEDEDWDLQGAVGLDAEERVGFKRRFETLQ